MVLGSAHQQREGGSVSATTGYRRKAKTDGRRTNRTEKRKAKKAFDPVRRGAAVMHLAALPSKVVMTAMVGRLGHPAAATVELDPVTLVGALEDRQTAAETLIKIGSCALVALVRYPLGEQGTSLTGLLEALCVFAGIDVTELRKQAAIAELAAQAEEGERVARAAMDAVASDDVGGQLELPL